MSKLRQIKPHLLSHKIIQGTAPWDYYSVFLSTWDDGMLNVSVGGAKRRQVVRLNKDQADELTRNLQSLKTEL